MAGLNRVQLIGNLGRDPEIRYTPSGVAVANFSIATSETWKDKNTGEKKTNTEWHKIVFWGRQAEVIGEYLSKGRQIYIEGKLQTREWEKEGVKRYTTEVVGREFLMLGQRGDNGGHQGGGGYQQNTNQTPNQNANQSSGGVTGAGAFPNGGYGGFDDDIPF